MQLQGIDWGDSWNEARDMVASGPPSWDATDALVTSNTYTIWSGIANSYREENPGWNRINKKTDDFTTGVNTFIGDGTVQTASVQHFRIKDVFEYFRANGSHAFQRDSMGWIAALNITIPMLTTICYSPTTQINVSNNEITVRVPTLHSFCDCHRAHIATGWRPSE